MIVHVRTQKGHGYRPAEADQVDPVFSDYKLGDMRQVFLQVSVAGAHEEKTLWCRRFEFADGLDLAGNSDQGIFRGLITIRGRISRWPLDMGIVVGRSSGEIHDLDAQRIA